MSSNGSSYRRVPYDSKQLHLLHVNHNHHLEGGLRRQWLLNCLWYDLADQRSLSCFVYAGHYHHFEGFSKWSQSSNLACHLENVESTIYSLNGSSYRKIPLEIRFVSFVVSLVMTHAWYNWEDTASHLRNFSGQSKCNGKLLPKRIIFTKAFTVGVCMVLSSFVSIEAIASTASFFPSTASFFSLSWSALVATTPLIICRAPMMALCTSFLQFSRSNLKALTAARLP